MHPSRRTFLQWAALSAALPQLPAIAAPAPTPSSGAAPLDTPLHWLDGAPPAHVAGTAWGVPWPQGSVARDSGFELRAPGGAKVALQSWPLAYWPDGSLKWSGHAMAALDAPPARLALQPVPAASGQRDAGMATQDQDGITVDTGVLRCRLPRKGPLVFATMERAGQALLRDGELVLLVDDAADDEGAAAGRRRYHSELTSVDVEQDGPVRAVLRLRGTHRRVDGGAQDATLLPFTLRLYFHRNADSVRILHTLVWDAEPARNFVRGVGLRFGVVLDGDAHDRHVRFVGATNGEIRGVFAESVRGLSGLRRDPGAAIVAAQHAGQPLPPPSTWPDKTGNDLSHIPAFGSYRLLQAEADGFSIAKRTSAGHAWVHSASGTRAAGTGYLGGRAGGVAFGVRHFWQSYPGQLDIDGAAGDRPQVTLWLWAPQAPAMDLRFYHDGLGQDTFAKQTAGVTITYEDYEPGFGTPYGVARTSELALHLLPATPDNAALAAIAQHIETPPRLMASPERLHAAAPFSAYWAPATGPQGDARAKELEARLAQLFAFYRDQVEERKWYGYWDYGDVMHTYDTTRHTWRYDVGGYAWDNTELSTEVWLWHWFLHSGRADAFRMAEAMTRHTSEVDVYHIGPFSPLGTRHGVQHWGDSAKQLRISTALNRRFLHYLAADERLGELLDEQVEGVRRLRDVVPGRKVGQVAATDPHQASVNFGTDWGAIAAAWYTAWERTGDTRHRDRLLASMAGIANQPHGFFTGVADMDLDTGAFIPARDGKLSVSHLSAVFGLTEICAELLRTLPQPAFRKAWLDYCRLVDAPEAEQKAALGGALKRINLRQGHARLLAFAAAEARDPALMREAWRRFETGNGGMHEFGNEGLRKQDFAQRRVRRPAVLDDVTEAPEITTNMAAQWALGALGMLALERELRLPGKLRPVGV